MSIIELSDSLINKIAAGEVIERPASVVKELIENSIDANAKNIVIEVKEGGKSYIKVQDDGHGMSKKDAKKSWKRHTTSKIKTIDDLFKVNTMGFRGEALASIASVSQISLTTKEKDSITGVQIKVKAGKLQSREEIGCPKGTTIEVKNLFFNTPARKKHMKTINVEFRHISDIVSRYALIHPEIHFRLVHNDNEVLNTPSSDSLTNISYIYGNKLAKQLLEVKYDKENLHIHGFISKPELSRSSKKDQSIYVNKRYVKHKGISDAINKAYSTMMMKNRYPVAILNITIDSEKIDVNVHPQKTEIKVHKEKELCEKIYIAIRGKLLESDLIPKAETPTKLKDFSSEESKEHSYTVEPEQKLLVQEKEESKTEKLPDMKIHGIVNKTYILAEMPGNLVLIDQHAAAERIKYEKFMTQLREKDVNVQKLLEPKVLEVTNERYSLALEHKNFLRELGFEVEDFGKNTLIIRTVPIVLGRQFNKEIFLDFVDDLEEGNLDSLEKFFHDRIATMACRSAIKAGDEITMPQIKKYIQELSKRDISYTCPHGRPILIKLSMYELEKMFKRVV